MQTGTRFRPAGLPHRLSSVGGVHRSGRRRRNRDERDPGVPLGVRDWDRLPARFASTRAEEAEWRDLLAALRRAVDEELTARQRRVFVAIVLDNIPLDALVVTSRLPATAPTAGPPGQVDPPGTAEANRN